jgi:hypothetical protein
MSRKNVPFCQTSVLNDVAGHLPEKILLLAITVDTSNLTFVSQCMFVLVTI